MQNAMRAVIYARYSSENQRDASIDDQVEVAVAILRTWLDPRESIRSRGLRRIQAPPELSADDS